MRVSTLRSRSCCSTDAPTSGRRGRAVDADPEPSSAPGAESDVRRSVSAVGSPLSPQGPWLRWSASFWRTLFVAVSLK